MSKFKAPVILYIHINTHPENIFLRRKNWPGEIHINNYLGSSSVNNPRVINIKIFQHILAQGVIFLPHYIERFRSNFELFLHMLSVHIFFILILTDVVISFDYTVLLWMYSLRRFLGKYLDIDCLHCISRSHWLHQ